MKLRIKEAIKEQGFTVQSVADKIGKSKQSLHGIIEKGNPTINTIMKADLVLVISPEAPLMKQLGKVLGRLCSMCDFSTIERGEKYVTIRHDETGLVVAYTSEERLNVKMN